MKTSLLLIFDAIGEHLGDVSVVDGALAHASLNADGERILGSAFESWQTQGIPSLRDVLIESPSESTDVMVEVRVMPREQGFRPALVHWLLSKRYRVIDLPDAIVPAWEKMLSLPLSPTERFAMLSALVRLPPEEIPKWMVALDEARKVVEKV